MKKNINKRVRAIAFYLPQFHPTPENNKWWGNGFTEWTNVAKAKPLFRGHEQPIIPGDLGFYDLRLPETRIAQAKIASKAGIEGFCYWHYWFNGKRMLERPFNEVLDSKLPSFPFCLGWANHSWTGIWKDEPDRYIIEQTYPGKDDDLKHFKFLLNAFKDKRYIQVDGKPLFVIFKPKDIPELKKKIDLWKELAIKNGLNGIYVLGVNMAEYNSGLKLGLDGVILSRLGIQNYNDQIANEASRIFWGVKKKLSIGGPRIIEYKEAIKLLVPDLNTYDVPAYPCIFPNWDNTPRKGKKGFVLKDSTPELFKKHLLEGINKLNNQGVKNKLVFIKSWNEWAEGNYLEPDLKWGSKYLEVLKEQLVD